MENTTNNHAKKCKSRCGSAGTRHPADPVWAKQGEWAAYKHHSDQGKHYSPLQGSGVCGYKKEASENWEDVLVNSELTHAREVTGWAERLQLVERAFQSKIRRIEREYATALEEGFEEAYEVVLETKKGAKEQEAWIKTLEDNLRLAQEEIAACHKVIQACCPENIKSCVRDCGQAVS